MSVICNKELNETKEVRIDTGKNRIGKSYLLQAHMLSEAGKG